MYETYWVKYEDHNNDADATYYPVFADQVKLDDSEITAFNVFYDTNDLEGLKFYQEDGSQIDIRANYEYLHSPDV